MKQSLTFNKENCETNSQETSSTSNQLFHKQSSMTMLLAKFKFDAVLVSHQTFQHRFSISHSTEPLQQQLHKHIYTRTRPHFSDVTGKASNCVTILQVAIDAKHCIFTSILLAVKRIFRFSMERYSSELHFYTLKSQSFIKFSLRSINTENFSFQSSVFTFQS